MDSEVFLRVHMIYNLTLDDKVFESERVRADKEQLLEDAQVRKRNKFVNLLTQFSNMNIMPTANIDLMNVHEKNK